MLCNEKLHCLLKSLYNDKILIITTVLQSVVLILPGILKRTCGSPQHQVTKPQKTTLPKSQWGFARYESPQTHRAAITFKHRTRPSLCGCAMSYPALLTLLDVRPSSLLPAALAIPGLAWPCSSLHHKRKRSHINCIKKSTRFTVLCVYLSDLWKGAMKEITLSR